MFIVRKFLVRKHERALMFQNGDFVRFLEPGVHYALDPLKRVSVEVFNVAVPLFEHRLADFFVKEYAQRRRAPVHRHRDRRRRGSDRVRERPFRERDRSGAPRAVLEGHRRCDAPRS